MKHKLQTAASMLLILFMPFMWYIDIRGTKVNFSLADFLLPVIGILILFNIKELFMQKRWLVILYFTGLIFSLALSQFTGRFTPDFLHVPNNVMLMEMVKTVVVAVYFIGAFLLINEKNFTISMVTLSLGSIPVMAIGFTSYIYFIIEKDFPVESYKLETTLRFKGTFEDPNLCALYFIMIFFVSLFCFKAVRNVFLKITLAGVSLLSLFCILLTLSRGGWLAFAGAILVFFVFNIKHIKKESLLVILSVIILVLAAANTDYWVQSGKVTSSIINRVQLSLNMEANDVNRVQLMKAAFQMGNDNFLFGVGKGSFPLNSNKYVGDDANVYKQQYIPHNTILGFYAQQGIIGLLLFIVLPMFLLYRMIRSRKRQNAYFIAIFAGLLLHSITINIENIRFAWFILGAMLASELKDFVPGFAPDIDMKRRPFTAVLAGTLFASILLFAVISTKTAVNIYTVNGNVYEKQISSLAPGDYTLSFDIQTDSNEHAVEIYDGGNLIRQMNFKSAYGFVSEPVSITEDARVVFRSSNDGWMKVNNAYLSTDNQKKPLYDYVLLPQFLQAQLNDKGVLTYLEEPPFKKEVTTTGTGLEGISLKSARVIRYSNLSHIFEFDYLCENVPDKNYQLDLLLEYPSLSSLLPDETQRNNITHRFTLSPATSKWETGKEYTAKSTRLFHSEEFNLFGRYYDYANKEFEQEAYFPIQYRLVYENQQLLPLGEINWINIRYSKDKENNIHMTYNGWVETERMRLDPGNHKITFTAQGSYYEGFSEVRLRDSSLNVLAVIPLDDIMKEYTVDYHTDFTWNGISFILELTNYKSEKDVGNRKVLLKDTVHIE